LNSIKQIFTEKKSSRLANSILAVVVIFRIRPKDCLSLITLNNACIQARISLDILVYDNSPERTYDKIMFSNLRLVKVIHDPSNPGVSKAYNQALNLANDLSKKWLFTLDQDSGLDHSYITNMLGCMKEECSIYAPLVKGNNGAIISPCKNFYNWSLPTNEVPIGSNPIKGYNLINSGLLISIDLLNKVGGYNLRLPLDFSDSYIMGRINKEESHFTLYPAGIIHNLSSTETNLEKIKARYLVYIRSASIFKKEADLRWLFCVFVFIRVIKMTIRFKSFFFLKHLYKT